MQNRDEFREEKGFKFWGSFEEQAYNDYLFYEGSPIVEYEEQNYRLRKEAMAARREFNTIQREYIKVKNELDEIKGNLAYQIHVNEKA